MPAKPASSFRTFPQSTLPPVSCGDFLAFDVDRYYDALAAVTQGAFTPKEVRDGVQYQFLLQRTAAIASPAQISLGPRAILSARTPRRRFSRRSRGLHGGAKKNYR
jgi:hypothetical protein